jgi:hypothetical protein
MLRFAVHALLGSFLLLPSSVGQQAAKQTPPAHQLDRSSAGVIVNGVYRNTFFGFSYKILFGWVDRTEAMQENDPAGQTPQSSKAQVLLAAFERPPEAPRSAVNSGVVIAVESTSSYSGLKEAVDYFGPLEQVTTSKGFKVVNEPYEFPVGGKPIAREDFSKEAGEMTMHQTCLVVLQKGYLLSFTFVSDSDDSMDELLEGLNFNAPQAPAKAHATPSKR